MELINDFHVAAPIETAWTVLTDIERIAPCMPGAQLTEVDGTVFSGTVKVKVGPITAQYRGKASFLEKDDTTHRAVIDASGRDTRGAGNANAIITAQLTADGEGTLVEINTNLKVTGKVAQFGRGVMADISEKLLGQFAECLAGKLDDSDESSAPESTDPEPTEPQAAEPSPQTDSGPRRIDMPEAQPVDLFEAAGAPVLKRAAPLLGLLFLWLLLRRRRSA